MSEQQLSMLIDTTSHDSIFEHVKKLFLFHYSQDDFSRTERHYRLINELFQGKYPGYRRCNTEYHNFSHTVDTLLAVMRLIDGFNLAEEPFPASTAAALLASALFHDTGYIQKDWDTHGTGAKYTREHVERSKVFVNENLDALGLDPATAGEINEYIDSTGIAPVLRKEESVSLTADAAERLLGAADLVAQMADRVYLEKLLFLYYEFREAGIEGYQTEFDIILKTIDFYEMAKERLEKDYLGVYHYASHHFRARFDISTNLYSKAIDNNIEYVRKIIADGSTNFRAKLHRISLQG